MTVKESLEKFELNKIITVQEVSEILGISPRAVQQKCEQGKLKCRKAGGTWLILKSSL